MNWCEVCICVTVQAVLRIEGANIFPFTANSLNIFVSALVDLLPNVTASDIVIGQVRVSTSSQPKCWLQFTTALLFNHATGMIYVLFLDLLGKSARMGEHSVGCTPCLVIAACSRILTGR